jgi:Xaa-Pro aminopeptidase
MPLTEMLAAAQLEVFRGSVGDYLGPSFDPIAAYGEHGAIVHYSATKETDAPLQNQGFLLLDTGGHYVQGTTDVTRTVLLGEDATAEEKRCYTAVLQGNLRLAAAKFKQGCSGVALDILARQPLWEMGLDFKHGTGHGVGCLLNVHEGPNSINYKVSPQPDGNCPLQPGMITSDEPGIYLEGKFGIRLENLILCEQRESNEFGQFLGFETLTLVPFERDAIDVDMLTQRDKELLNEYHEKVYETLKPYLTGNEADWLLDVCAPID